MRRSAGFALLCAALATLAAPAAAHAFERQWHAGIGYGVATFPGADAPLAPLAGIHGAYGVSDFFDVRVDLFIAMHSFAEGQRTFVHSASAGMAYKLDVFEWIPWAALEIGAYGMDGDPGLDGRSGSIDPGGSVALGLDYALSRRFGLGGEGRMHMIMGTAEQGTASYLTFLVRAEYRWGW